MRNLLFKNRNLTFGVMLVLVLIIGSCVKEKCDSDNNVTGGGSALVNGNNMEFGVGYGDNSNGKYSLFLDNSVWIDNTVWALRNRISIQNLELNLNDTMILNHQPVGQATKLSAFFSTLLADGDLSGECYELLETAAFQNWIVLSEHQEEIGEIAGSLQASFLISDNCPPKDISSDPDTIYLTECSFRAVKID